MTPLVDRRLFGLEPERTTGHLIGALAMALGFQIARHAGVNHFNLAFGLAALGAMAADARVGVLRGPWTEYLLALAIPRRTLVGSMIGLALGEAVAFGLIHVVVSAIGIVEVCANTGLGVVGADAHLSPIAPSPVLTLAPLVGLGLCTALRSVFPARSSLLANTAVALCAALPLGLAYKVARASAVGGVAVLFGAAVLLVLGFVRLLRVELQPSR